MKVGAFGGLVATWLLTTSLAYAQQCQPTGTNQTCTNSTALTGGTTGLTDTATPTVTNNSGASITGVNAGGTAIGLNAGQNLNLTNAGTVLGSGLQSIGISATNDVTIVNSGTIAGLAPTGVLGYGINTGNNANVTNSGTIAGRAGANGIAIGLLAFTNANATNSGTVSAIVGDNGTSYGLLAGLDIRLSNTGTVLSSTGLTGLAIGVRGVNNADVTNAGNIVVSAGAGSQAYGVLASNGIARVTNSGTVSVTADTGGQAYAVAGLAGSADVTNSGTLSAKGGNFGFGIQAGQDIALTNTGAIAVSADQQGIGVFAGRNAVATNAGSITVTVVGTGFAFGVATAQDATVTNSGTISAIASGAGRGVGISATNDATIVNAGTITGATAPGGQGFGVQVFGTAKLTNSGTISGTSAALEFAGGPDTLTVLPGSRIIGAIDLGGGGDTVNFRGGNHNLTFDTLAGATVTGTTPFVVSGNRAVAIDPSTFALTGRTLADFSRSVFDAVPVFTGSGTGAPNGAPLAFAAIDAGSRIDDAFAAMPGLSAYAGTGPAFKNPTVVYGDGSAVWARGFGGQRIQQQDGVLLRTTNLFYGGMIGGDWQARPGLRLGAFLGGGQTRGATDLNLGSANADLIFGGAYARYDIGASFLHAAVQVGSSRNGTSRTINNNLVAGGLETASAGFDGWYVSPEATFGHRFALGSLAGASYTLTSSVRLRYLYGSYGGYTETGTTAPLTVTDQTLGTFEERGDMKLTRSVSFAPGNVLSTSLSAGVLGTQRVGSNTINASLLGQAIPFAVPGQANVWGGFGGLGLEWQSRSVTLFSAAEYLALSDQSTIVSGRAGLRVAF